MNCIMINKKMLALFFYLVSCGEIISMEKFDIANTTAKSDESCVHNITLTLARDFDCTYEQIKKDMELLKKHINVDNSDSQYQTIKCLPFKIKLQKKLENIDDILPHLTRMYKVYANVVECEDSITAEKLDKYGGHNCIMIDTEVLDSNSADVDKIIKLYDDYRNEYQELLSESEIEESEEIDENYDKIMECCYVLDHCNVMSQDILNYIYSILNDTGISPYSDIDGAPYECFELMEKYLLRTNLVNAEEIDSQMFKSFTGLFSMYIEELLYFANQ